MEEKEAANFSHASELKQHILVNVVKLKDLQKSLFLKYHWEACSWSTTNTRKISVKNGILENCNNYFKMEKSGLNDNIKSHNLYQIQPLQLSPY